MCWNPFKLTSFSGLFNRVAISLLWEELPTDCGGERVVPTVGANMDEEYDVIVLGTGLKVCITLDNEE